MKKHQKRWDQLLMVAWEKHYKLGWCIARFSEEFNLKGNELYDTIRKLKRSTIRRGGPVNPSRPVRALVDCLSPSLSKKLWDGEVFALMAAGNLDDYVWKTKISRKRTYKEIKARRTYLLAKRNNIRVRHSVDVMGYHGHGKHLWGVVS